jgi:hypothetical protein
MWKSPAPPDRIARFQIPFLRAAESAIPVLKVARMGAWVEPRRGKAGRRGLARGEREKNFFSYVRSWNVIENKGWRHGKVGLLPMSS